MERAEYNDEHGAFTDCACAARGSPAQSQPCEAMSAHGFLGKESDTVGAIANWMLKQPYPREIN